MKILVLDENKTRRIRLTEILEKKRHEVTACSQSNAFITAIEKNFDTLLLDVESWNRGRAIYHYLGIGRRLAGRPIIFYNAPPEFSAIGHRPRNPKDKILVQPSEVEAIVAGLPETR